MISQLGCSLNTNTVLVQDFLRYCAIEILLIDLLSTPRSFVYLWLDSRSDDSVLDVSQAMFDLESQNSKFYLLRVPLAFVLLGLLRIPPSVLLRLLRLSFPSLRWHALAAATRRMENLMVHSALAADLLPA